MAGSSSDAASVRWQGGVPVMRKTDLSKTAVASGPRAGLPMHLLCDRQGRSCFHSLPVPWRDNAKPATIKTLGVLVPRPESPVAARAAEPGQPAWFIRPVFFSTVTPG